MRAPPPDLVVGHVLLLRRVGLTAGARARPGDAAGLFTPARPARMYAALGNTRRKTLALDSHVASDTHSSCNTRAWTAEVVGVETLQAAGPSDRGPHRLFALLHAAGLSDRGPHRFLVLPLAVASMGGTRLCRFAIRSFGGLRSHLR